MSLKPFRYPPELLNFSKSQCESIFDREVIKKADQIERPKERQSKYEDNETQKF